MGWPSALMAVSPSNRVAITVTAAVSVAIWGSRQVGSASSGNRNPPPVPSSPHPHRQAHSNRHTASHSDSIRFIPIPPF